MDIIIIAAVIGAVIMIFRLIFRNSQLEKDDFADLRSSENEKPEASAQTNERLDREIDELIKQYHKESTPASTSPRDTQAPAAETSCDRKALEKEIEDLDRHAAEKAVEAEDIHDEIRRVQQQLKELKRQAREHEDAAEELRRESAAKKEQLRDTEKATSL